MKLLSLFSGIGAFEKALKRLGIDYDLVNYCEIDKYASKSYALIHGCSEDKNLGDITKVDTSKLPKDIDLISYGFPCQDISLAGNQKGFENEDGTKTRSGLFFEALRLIEDLKPKVAIAENVKNLVSKKFKNEFEIVLQSLEEAGYNNYYQILNAKDYGMPQNRERVFIVSIRKDIDDGTFKFPKKIPLELRIKDMLEDEVDEKYYLSDKILIVGKTKSGGQRSDIIDEDGISSYLTAIDYKQPKQVLVRDGLWTETQAKMITPDGNIKRYIGSDVVDEFKEGQVADISFPNGYNKGPRVHDECPAINTTTTQNSFVVKEPGSSYVRNFGSRGKLQNGEDVCDTLVVAMGTGGGNVPIVEERVFNLRIRKLTPKECWRLMDFDDEDVDALIENKISNTQLYKQAGNSIVVRVIQYILENLKELLISTEEEKQ